jgi:hypothetical protein
MNDYKDHAYKYERIILQNKCKNPEDCSICLDSLLMKQVAYLPCKHSFHQACLKQAFEKELYSCPLCRYNLVNALQNANFIFPPVDDPFAHGGAYIYTYVLPYVYNGDTYMNASAAGASAAGAGPNASAAGASAAGAGPNASAAGASAAGASAAGASAAGASAAGAVPNASAADAGDDMPDLVDSDDDMPHLVDFNAEADSNWSSLLIYIMQDLDDTSQALDAEPEVLFRL